MTRRLPLTILFAGLTGGAFFLTAQPDTIKKIADGVWFREGDIKKQGHCNNIIIEMKEYLIVIDANFPSGAQIVINEAKKLSSKPIKYVFDTHHHGDHAYGNAVFTKIGATTIAHAGVAAEMKAREPERWQQAAKERKDVADMKASTVEPPKQTFTTSPHVITDGTRRVEFHHFGWAHTKGDGFAFLPKEGIICTGDAVVNGPYNYTADGNVGNWVNVVKGAQKLNPKTVLPAHGPHGGPEILSGEALFMTELMNTVKAARASGKKLSDVVKMEKGQPKSTTLTLPASVKNWVGDFLPAQVYDTWMELENKKPRGDLKL
ncbi:MAG: MBL fold metallo-hydrolase [Bryobacteraceae bacterium]